LVAGGSIVRAADAVLQALPIAPRAIQPQDTPRGRGATLPIRRLDSRPDLIPPWHGDRCAPDRAPAAVAAVVSP
jgi:hypothetical protein